MPKTAMGMAFIAFLLTAAAAVAQEGQGEVSVQGMGFFTKDSRGNGIFQRGTESGGLLASYRRHVYRWISVEAAYGYSRNSQQYFQPFRVANIETNVHEATGGFVFKLPAVFKLEPYALAEGGALVFAPRTGLAVSNQAEGTFVYGAGANYPILGSHFLLRAEYRGLVYNTPDFGFRNLSTNTWTHTAQPSAGIVFRF
jgi:hypothetical protein